RTSPRDRRRGRAGCPAPFRLQSFGAVRRASSRRRPRCPPRFGSQVASEADAGILPNRRRLMASKTKSATIRERLSHPIVDADGHFVETLPVLHEYMREVAGSRLF